MTNIVFIATSLDGCIADKEGKLDWLHSVPNPDNLDGGFASFMDRVDAVVMGRATFQTVAGFDVEWPYKKPVFVLSHSMTSLPDDYQGKAELIQGSPSEVVKSINSKGFQNLYIDGGITIQNFLKEDLIDEIIITLIPILLGGGRRLFGELAQPILFDLVKSDVMLGKVVQNHFRRSL